MFRVNLLRNIYNLKVVVLFSRLYYLLTGRRPWSLGYIHARNNYINKTINSKKYMNKFGRNMKLNYGYGLNFDERVVEYPWVLSRINKKNRRVLDAGSTLNQRFILQKDILKNNDLVIASLGVEFENYSSNNVSYVYGNFGDIRMLPFKNELFDFVVCISVLEHVGMDNSKIYVKDYKYKQNNKYDFLKAIAEFYRVLKKNGICLITIPYGKYKNHGWFQQFDNDMVSKIIRKFGRKSNIQYYRYSKRGWQIAKEKECKNLSYGYMDRQDYRCVAASAVVCIELKK